MATPSSGASRVVGSTSCEPKPVEVGGYGIDFTCHGVTGHTGAEAAEELNVGGGTVLDIKDARANGYAVEDGVETWRLTDFEAVKRTKITHKVS